jgi:hypothetical protein
MRRGPSATNDGTIAFEPNEVGSAQAAPQISKTAVRPEHANLQQDGRSQIITGKRDSLRGSGSTIGKTPGFLPPTARVGLPSALNRPVSAESRVLHSSRLTDWENQQIQRRLRHPAATIPDCAPLQDLTTEKVQEEDTSNALKRAPTVQSEGPGTALERQPGDEAPVDGGRRQLPEHADTSDHDGAPFSSTSNP